MTVARQNKTSKKALFIVIESIDGGGGSTQTMRLAEAAQQRGLKVHQYHFPQEDAPTGRVIYNKFLNNTNKFSLTRREQALLYIQDFYSQADEMSRIRAAGSENLIVADRYYTSTLAYQTINLTGQQRQRQIKWIKELCEKGTPRLLKPDLVLFLDTPIIISLQRLKKGARDYHENKQKLTQFRNSYLRIAQEEQWYTINSVDETGKQRSIDDLQREIWSVIQKKLPS